MKLIMACVCSKTKLEYGDYIHSETMVQMERAKQNAIFNFMVFICCYGISPMGMGLQMFDGDQFNLSKTASVMQ